jgi:uncharacterized damage-inducible protein DinB
MELRPGAIGAMTDEYEKALTELQFVLKSITDEIFLKEDISKEEDFKSIRNIILHIIRSGYIYSDYVRKKFGDEIISKKTEVNSLENCLSELEKMFLYHVKTFENKWQVSDEDLSKTYIKTSWKTYDLEGIVEHAIVHILRHRLQIEKLLKST